MSDAAVRFGRLDDLEVTPGQEQTFSFACPKHRGRRCEGLVIVGRTALKRNPQGQDGGVAQWTWNGDRERPTFAPSINCTRCWHGFIENGRCVGVNHQDEPEP